MKDSGLSVLIVEDEKLLRDAYSIILSSQGYAVETASNGIDALTKAKRSKPAVILLDIMMPVMDGKEFMRNIDMNDYPNTKVIVYSNMSDRSLEEEMLQLGASQVITKSSVTPSRLIEIVEESR